MESESKAAKYAACLAEFTEVIKGIPAEEEAKRQKALSETVSKHFPAFNFVGFYDLRKEGDEKIYLGEFVCRDMYPCREIDMGKGQCGQCAQEKKTLILKDVKEAKNYIPCDEDTQSEIVVPCFKDGVFRTVFDLDSPNVGEFDEEDAKGLEALSKLIYP